MPYLSWLCLRNPTGCAKLVVVELSGVAVGGMIMVPVPLALAGTVLPSWFVANVLTDPAQRKLGLFSRMIDACKNYAAARSGCVVGHPNQAAIRGWQRAEMTFQPSLIPHLAWVSSPGRILRSRPLSALGGVLAALESRSTKCRPESLELLRSPEFMEWRFVLRPDVSYRLLVHQDSGLPDAFAMVRSWRFGLDLMVDAWIDDARPHGKFGFLRPTIVPANDSASGSLLSGSFRSLIRLDSRSIRYFADRVSGAPDGCRLTLAVSDF